MFAYYMLEKDGEATTPVNVDHLKGHQFRWISEVMKNMVTSMKKNKRSKYFFVYEFNKVTAILFTMCVCKSYIFMLLLEHITSIMHHKI